MEKRNLECGHRIHVQFDAKGTWCPACNEYVLVTDQI